MSVPKITVLMPVYNGEKHLAQAVDSILSQTYSDFEFLIINDGSSDGSVDIINLYNDTRVRLLSNNQNLGLIATLNKGIDLARGEYIARMDCDDISLPKRLAKQAEFLEADHSCAMVAAKAVFIDDDGKECGYWGDDQNSTSYREIVRRLPRANCIAHPGVMIRKSVLATYRYDARQVHSEDYDLWLRLCADGVRIEKIDEILLKYRLNPLSVTAQSSRKCPDFKNVKTKSIFVWTRMQAGAVNWFVSRVFFNLFKDLYYLAGKAVLAAFKVVPSRKR
jgi:glycosyltransferase involved in cell wall biosynthesis